MDTYPMAEYHPMARPNRYRLVQHVGGGVRVYSDHPTRESAILAHAEDVTANPVGAWVARSVSLTGPVPETLTVYGPTFPATLSGHTAVA